MLFSTLRQQHQESTHVMGMYC